MIDLMPSQATAKKHLLEWTVGALFMQMGTGKTRVAMEIVNSIADLDLVVWVGPYQTIHREDGVQAEIAKWGGLHSKEVVFIGIETLQSSDRAYLQLFAKIRVAWSCFLIVDESLKIKNIEAKRTKRLIELSRMVKFKLILNGTPFSKNLMDVWAQMDFLSPLILNMGLAEFKSTFCKVTTVTHNSHNRSFTKEFITGYENIDYLYSLIRHYVFECDLQLQVKKLYNTLYYELSEEEMEAYEEIKVKFLNDEMLLLRNNNIFLEMTQKMQHGYSVSAEKFERLDELFKEIEQNKAIVFCKYIVSREECQMRYPKATVLSYQKESLGLNLQHLKYTIYFDKIWDYALRIQSMHRTYRTGQEEDCRYWDLTGNVGLERLIDKNIEKKVSMIEYFKSKTKQQLIDEL